MPRIRSIKPDFWDSPGTAKCSLRGRLFYIAMWNWADDWGIGDANPRRLLSFAFPNDESSEVEPRNFRRLASEVAECFSVTWYEVDGRPYYEIPTWEQHQRTEKKARRVNPPSDQAERFLFEENAEVPTPSGGSADDGSGKGEVGSGKKEVVKDTSDPTFDGFWAAYPKRADKGHARTAWAKAVRKADATEIVEAALRFANDPNLPEPKYIPLAATWLNGERWEDGPLPDRRDTPRSSDRQGDVLRAEMERARIADAANENRLEIEA